MSMESPDSLRAPTVDTGGRRVWIYPERRSGPISRRRRAVAMVLLMLYLLTPYLSFQGRPLLRFSVLEGIVYVFGQSFRFADGSYLVFVLLALALGLGLVTSLWGRIWCSYGCPQTIFVEWVIRPLEELIEGPALRRKRQDAAAWHAGVLLRKGLKYIACAVVVWLISNAFLAYFVDPQLLRHWMLSSPMEHPWAFLFMVSCFLALFFDLVWFREQFCSFLCPYARFQSLMMGYSTPTITYDQNRGEPRGKRQTEGACIDCQLCKRVCPTGIDIRNGLQLECIQCGRCADACQSVMKNLNRGQSLIRYVSESQLAGIKVRRLGLRPLVYLVLLLANLGLLFYSVGTRDQLKLTITRQTGSTFTVVGDQGIANYFTLHVVNQKNLPQVFELKPPPDVHLICSICGFTLRPEAEIRGILVVIATKKTLRQGTLALSQGQGHGQYVLPLLGPK